MTNCTYLIASSTTQRSTECAKHLLNIPTWPLGFMFRLQIIWVYVQYVLHISLTTGLWTEFIAEGTTGWNLFPGGQIFYAHCALLIDHFDELHYKIPVSENRHKLKCIHSKYLCTINLCHTHRHQLKGIHNNNVCAINLYYILVKCHQPNNNNNKKWQLHKRKYLENIISTKEINVQAKELHEKGTFSAEGYKTQATLEKKRAAATCRVYSKRAYHADPKKEISF